MDKKSQSEKNNVNDLPSYLFHQGTNFNAQDYLGVHGKEIGDGRFEYSFRVWAPGAESVSVVGDFSSWDQNKGIPMERVTEQGVWEAIAVFDRSIEGRFYKYAVRRGGVTWLKADPYAFQSETLEKTASIVRTLPNFKWEDASWMRFRRKQFHSAASRKTSHFYPSPMNIYELHLGSWRTKDGACTADGKHYLNYREIADELVPYVKEMGYTHVELLPVMEHPFDGSWGYQICGYFAPTSRFGNPEDFMYFVNRLHKAGIGVILDWVPAHFPKDRHGLFEFDGGPLYEYQGSDRMEHHGWGTRCFDVGRTEVQSFLISNALFWLGVYHADGLRIDAVASMLYLDYDRKLGEWIPNVNGDNKNLEAIAFFRKLNTAVFAAHPDVLMIAEESTSWPMITKRADEGGLGFNFKWNMGWANDMFQYMSSDPFFRQYMHDKLTFPLMYAFSENYVLPVSHDEVVHGKKSLIDKMSGEYDSKFASMRTFLANMMTLPGKKLTFMGTEFAQFREWDYENQLEWFMLEFPRHSEMKNYVRQLNALYLESPELWEIDDSWDGFEWIDADLSSSNLISYKRKSASGRELIVILNFSPIPYGDYTFNIPRRAEYEIVFSSDRYEFGGKNDVTEGPLTTDSAVVNGERIYRVTADVPPLCALIIKKSAKKSDKGRGSGKSGASGKGRKNDNV